MRFLKLKEVMEKTALSRSAIYRKLNDGEFPQSVSLGDSAIVWVESEVDGRSLGETLIEIARGYLICNVKSAARRSSSAVFP